MSQSDRMAAIPTHFDPKIVPYSVPGGGKCHFGADGDPYARLGTEFGHSGFRLTQLKRVGDVAIYKQTKGKQPSAFEVVVIRRREACVAFGTELPATEFYPTNTDWGSTGFTYRTLEEAERKFMELTDKERESDATS
jgi:hypothetical protein